MAVHKLYIDEFDEIDYQLIAIHTSLEDYRLAFFINQKLPVLLGKSKDGIQITSKNGSSFLSRYMFEDAEKSISWNLLQNKSEISRNTISTTADLFARENIKVAAKAYLLPEFKTVDYFLQLQNTEEPSVHITDALQQIEQVTMSYTVDMSRIKSKNNLIF
jgi:hypothetical protein